MQNKKKGIVAAAAGAALLLAGGTTFALWSDTATLPGGNVNTGTLSLNASTLDWTLVDSTGSTQAISFTYVPEVPTVHAVGYVNAFNYTLPAAWGGNIEVSGYHNLYRLTGNISVWLGVTESYAIRTSPGVFANGLPHNRFTAVERQADGSFSTHSGSTLPTWQQTGPAAMQRSVEPIIVDAGSPAIPAFGFVPGTTIRAEIEISPEVSGTGLIAELSGLPLYGGTGSTALGSYFVRVGDDVVGEIRPSVRVIDHANPTAYHPVRYTQQTAVWETILLGREAGATFVLELAFVSGQGLPQHAPGSIELDDIVITLTQAN